MIVFTPPYKCDKCGAIFDKPSEKSWREEMSGDGWAWKEFRELFCPECGSDEIDLMTEEINEHDDA